MDPYEWLPPGGATRISLTLEGLDLRVDIAFHREDDPGETTRSIVFSHACWFSCSSFPGVDLSRVQRDEACLSGDLVEYEGSEAARARTRHFGSFKVRHYWMSFPEANQVIEVFAEAWRLMD